MIKIKDTSFDVGIKSIDRETEFVEDYNVQSITGDINRSVSGVRVKYTVTVDMLLITPEEYTALYEALTSPEAYVKIEFPYNQETISGDFCISGTKDTLERLLNGKNYWTDLQFTATSRKLIKKTEAV